MKKQLSFVALTLLPSLFSPAFAADLPLDTPTEDFTINNDGTATHTKTGLSWQRCSIGQTWNGSTCDGTVQNFTWDDAMTNYNTDCNGWRLPRIDELNTITEHGKFNPAINSTIFPNTPAVFYWSASSADAYYPNYKWIVHFYSGNATYDDKSRNYSIRLVKSGNACSFDTFTPASDFTDNGDGTVTHAKTNLMWQRCLLGQTWNGKTCSGFSTIFNGGESKNQTDTFAGYSDWRVPTLNELNTVVEYKNYLPTMNKNVFPGAESGVFWSSSIGANNSNFSWIVHFDSGNTSSGDYRANGGAILFVRGKWSSPASVKQETVDLSATVAGSPNSVFVNKNLTYTGTVKNNGNTTATDTTLTFTLVKGSMSFVSAPKDCVNKDST
ncbi:MAG: DUF1566 domain-containing protein, partial [Methylococcales bacterium]|nr:DUF1566 domain-containing protein [Methylococcales bacterium]